MIKLILNILCTDTSDSRIRDSFTTEIFKKVNTIDFNLFLIVIYYLHTMKLTIYSLVVAAYKAVAIQLLYAYYTSQKKFEIEEKYQI